MTSAELCRANGWKVGDVLETTNNDCNVKIQIIGISDKFVTVRSVRFGSTMDMKLLEGWHKVADNTKGGG